MSMDMMNKNMDGRLAWMTGNDEIVSILLLRNDYDLLGIQSDSDSRSDSDCGHFATAKGRAGSSLVGSALISSNVSTLRFFAVLAMTVNESVTNPAPNRGWPIQSSLIPIKDFFPL